MADFAPPSGPPPPKVPEGWKAQFNAQYNEWFYVNLYTKKSQWDKPTEPARNPEDDNAPDGPPPSYDNKNAPSHTGDEKKTLGSNNPYSGSNAGTSSSQVDEDARLAAQLQAEEEAKHGAAAKDRGASDSYYQQDQNPSYGGSSASYQGQQSTSPLPGSSSDRGSKSGGGLLGKLASKLGGKSSSQQGYGQNYNQGYGQQQYYQQGPPQQQYYGGGYPPQQQQYYGGGYPQQQQYQKKSSGMGGMGMLAGGAALGLGAGLLAEDYMDHEEQQAYDQGYDNGQDNGGGGFDDGGGGDFGGGDF